MLSRLMCFLVFEARLEQAGLLKRVRVFQTLDYARY